MQNEWSMLRGDFMLRAVLDGNRVFPSFQFMVESSDCVEQFAVCLP